MLKELIEHSENIVFFGGAGTSTESGIPDFRSVDGLYNMQYKYPPEMILSSDFFYKNPLEFFRFYRDKMICTSAMPNDCHKKLVELEKEGKLKAIITQNIDGLHQKAGSKNVIELHGSIHRNTCVKCGEKYDLDYITSSFNIPRCPCGGIIKPDVVLYGESLNYSDIERALEYISKADMLIVAGTSLTVYPAASFIEYYKGNKLVLINKDETSRDQFADYIIHDSVGKVMRF